MATYFKEYEKYEDYKDFDNDEKPQECIDTQNTYTKEEDMFNAIQESLKNVVDELNIQDCEHKEITKLKENFNMTKYIANLTLSKEKVHLITKVLLANLVSSAHIIKHHARVLTSARRIAAHLNISTEQVYYQLATLQELSIEKKVGEKIEDIPIIVCRPYNVVIPKNDQTTCKRLSPGCTSRKIMTYEDYLQRIKEAGRSTIRSMGFDARERPIEIIIPTYNYFKYNKNRKKDFFFEVHASWGVPELSLVERIFMFLIQKHTYINRIYEGNACIEGSLGMYANIFKVGIPYVRKVLYALDNKGYIHLEIYDFTAYIQLQPKGYRKIAYYEEQLAQARREGLK